MTAAEIFEVGVKTDVAPTLVSHGFKRAKALFRRDGDETVQFVAFQRSRKSTRDEVWFAVNMSVASRLLLANRGDSSPTPVNSHWTDRLSPGQRSDNWWHVVDEASAKASMAQCVALLQSTALPTLDMLSTNASLRDRWLSGRAEGLSEVQRLVNLHRLISAVGPADQLARVTNELEQLARDTSVPAAVAYLRLLARKDEPSRSA